MCTFRSWQNMCAFEECQNMIENDWHDNWIYKQVELNRRKLTSAAFRKKLFESVCVWGHSSESPDSWQKLEQMVSRVCGVFVDSPVHTASGVTRKQRQQLGANHT